MRTLVDTNIWLYLLDRRSPEKQRVAEALITRMTDLKQVVVSTQVLSELASVLFRWKSSGIAHGEVDISQYVNDVRGLSEVLSIKPNFPGQAARLAQTDSTSFWDALLIVTAADAGVGMMYSEDLGHNRRYAGVHVINPFL